MQRSPKDILAGLVFIAFGLVFAIGATTYPVGSTLQMGPGYFPLALGGLLIVLGGAVAARGYFDGEVGPIGSIPWRPLALVLGAIVFFGLTVRGLGLVPATFVGALLSALASYRTGAFGALVIAIGLTVMCVLIFVVALRLNIPLVGPWVRW